ncbi:MAG: hypothetical protein AAF961_01430 [Planctomycetota bacterium]
MELLGPALPWVAQDLLAQAGAGLDAQATFGIFSRALHILPAVIVGGGLFYVRTMLAPAGGDPYAGRRELWAKWVGVCTFLLLISGIYNLIAILRQAKSLGVEIPPTYHMLFGVKFLLALFVMFVAAVLAGESRTAENFRNKMSRWLNLAWFAILAIIVLGAVLRAIRAGAVASLVAAS